MTEFNLSEKFDKVKNSDGTHNMTDIEKLEKHVKEFIKRLDDIEKDLMEKYGEGEIKDLDEFIIIYSEKRNKLAGDKLK